MPVRSFFFLENLYFNDWYFKFSSGTPQPKPNPLGLYSYTNAGCLDATLSLLLWNLSACRSIIKYRMLSSVFIVYIKRKRSPDHGWVKSHYVYPIKIFWRFITLCSPTKVFLTGLSSRKKKKRLTGAMPQGGTDYIYDLQVLFSTLFLQIVHR